MTDGGQDFNLGHVVGSAGEKGDDGSTVWNTSTAPTYANSKYTFTISNLSGKTGLEIAVNDIIFYSTYYYIVSAVNTTTVDCSTRVSIKGSDATVTIATSFGSTPSDSKVPSEKLTKNSLDAKQATLVSGTNIKTINNNSLLGSGNINIESGSNVDIVTSWEQTLSDSKVPSEKLVKNTIDTKADSSDIPTKTSDLTNDGADGTNVFVANNDSRLSDARTPTSHTHGQVTNDGKITSTAVTVATGDNIVITDYSDSSKIKRVANILADHVKDSTAHSNIGSSASATQATINSSIDTALSNKVSKSQTSGLLKNDGTIDTSSYLTTGSASSTYQPKLTSGTNIKTINNESLLGSGNITIQGGSSVDVVTSWEATLSDSKVPSEKLVKNTIDGLSIPTKTSDLTNDGDGTNVFVKNNDSRLTDARTPTSHTHGNLTNDGKVGSTANYFVYTTTGGAITSKQKIGNITTSGAIGSASGLPVITTASGVLTTGSFGTGSGTFAEGNHTHSAYVNPTKVTSWSSTPSDSNVASEKLIKDSLDGKQASLVSGTNIKTVNNQSLLGSGNITIQGGSSVDIVTAWESTLSDSKVASEKLTKDTIDLKQNQLVSGTNIKTINNQSILGSGNLTVSGGGSTGDYFFTLDSFFDPNQWTGSPTISNGSIVLSAESTFPLRLPPNCTLSFDITVTSGYDEYIALLNQSLEVNYDWISGGVADFTFTCSNNSCALESEATGDGVTISNVASRYGLTIPITNGTTATISNVKYRNKETEEIYDLIGNAITYINGSGS